MEMETRRGGSQEVTAGVGGDIKGGHHGEVG